MLATFLTADPSFATTTLTLAGTLLTDLFPYVQPIMIVGIVVIAIYGITKIIKS